MEPALDLVHPRGDLAGRAAQGRGAGSLGGRKTASGVAEQRLARLGIGTAIGGEKGLRLARGEQVALGGARQAELFPLGEGREQGGEREREMASIDPRGQIFRQTTAQSQASLDPGRLSPQQLRDRRDRQAVVLRERSHDAASSMGLAVFRGLFASKRRALIVGPSTGSTTTGTSPFSPLHRARRLKPSRTSKLPSFPRATRSGSGDSSLCSECSPRRGASVVRSRSTGTHSTSVMGILGGE